jgi:CheY-like chemotaxis protein
MADRPSLVREFAHELRNAISPIRTAMELLRMRGADHDTLPKILATVDRGLNSALQTIDCFVNADRAASGCLPLNVAPIHVHRVIDVAIARSNAQFDAHKQVAKITGVADDIEVFADAEFTAQVLTALFEHASRSSGQGATIEIAVRQRPDAAEIRVRSPMPPGADVDSWFDSYRAPGTGSRMALRTARLVIELQRGALTATIDRESGAADLVATLPRSPPSQPAHDIAAGTPEPSAGLEPAIPGMNEGRPSRILVVDDNTAVRNGYREALEEMGYEVVLAANGEEALRLAEESAPDVALIDIHLPTLNGYQVARALKARHASKPIRLVMLSGMTLDDTTRRLSQNAGFDDCVDKGAGPRALDALLKGGNAKPGLP